MRYAPIGLKTEVESAIARNNPEELCRAALSAALGSDDSLWAEKICIQLATYPHEYVRGNAILGFGHLARIHRQLSSDQIKQLIESALRDESSYVRGQAEAAADDVELFLKWKVRRSTV